MWLKIHLFIVGVCFLCAIFAQSENKDYDYDFDYDDEMRTIGINHFSTNDDEYVSGDGEMKYTEEVKKTTSEPRKPKGRKLISNENESEKYTSSTTEQTVQKEEEKKNGENVTDKNLVPEKEHITMEPYNITTEKTVQNISTIETKPEKEEKKNGESATETNVNQENTTKLHHNISGKNINEKNSTKELTISENNTENRFGSDNSSSVASDPSLTTPTTTSSVTNTFLTTLTTTIKPDEKGPLLKGFNWNYLFFLFLLIPIGAVGIGVTFFCKRKKRKDSKEPSLRVNKRRFSTPSWVFSEPDFADEEIETLQEQKK